MIFYMSSKHRVAIINKDRCKPTKCKHECQKICPENRQGKECVTIPLQKKATAVISEVFCIGCNMCTKVCPFDAIQIVNLPKELDADIIYRYGPNEFRLYRLPLIKKGTVMGILGPNGIGKSTVLSLLSGTIKPNFELNNGNDGNDTIRFFRGTSLQNYFNDLYSNKLRIVQKPQMIEQLAVTDVTVSEYLNNVPRDLIDKLKLGNLMESQLSQLSGGELQLTVCCKIFATDADVYIFDEPTNFLDVSQRVVIGELLQTLVEKNRERYVILVEHDLAILDFAADNVCIMYGVPGAYGVVSLPHTTSNGINIFFRGYIPSENMRIREEPYNYRLGMQVQYDEQVQSKNTFEYPEISIEYPNFHLSVKNGSISLHSSITVVLGRNGTGKSSMMNRLRDIMTEQGYHVSHKPQHPELGKLCVAKDVFPTVQSLLHRKRFISRMIDPVFQSDVVKPLNINFKEKKVNLLSGGELQRLMILCCLATEADMYILDEPSANLDIEQRAVVTKVLKRFLVHFKTAGFIIEHDILMATSLASEEFSNVIVLSGDPSHRIYHADQPKSFNHAMNKFLKDLNITLRSDKVNGRPRINRILSGRDQEQKKTGTYIE